MGTLALPLLLLGGHLCPQLCGILLLPLLGLDLHTAAAAAAVAWGWQRLGRSEGATVVAVRGMPASQLRYRLASGRFMPHDSGPASKGAPAWIFSPALSPLQTAFLLLAAVQALIGAAGRLSQFPACLTKDWRGLMEADGGATVSKSVLVLVETRCGSDRKTPVCILMPEADGALFLSGPCPTTTTNRFSLYTRHRCHAYRPRTQCTWVSSRAEMDKAKLGPEWSLPEHLKGERARTGDVHPKSTRPTERRAALAPGAVPASAPLTPCPSRCMQARRLMRR